MFGRSGVWGSRCAKAPALETLESRRLLSGDVLVIVEDGLLIVHGDTRDNAITIDQDGLGVDEFRVTGTDETTVNGQIVPRIFEGVRRGIRVELDQGSDSVSFVGAVVPRGLVVTNDAGSDALALTSTEVEGDLLVTGGGGNDQVVLDDALIHGVMTVANAGQDVLRILDSWIVRDFTWTAAQAPSEFAVTGSRFDRNVLAVNAGAATFADTNVGRDLQFTGVVSPSLSGGEVGRDLVLAAADGTLALANKVRVNRDVRATWTGAGAWGLTMDDAFIVRHVRVEQVGDGALTLDHSAAVGRRVCLTNHGLAGADSLVIRGDSRVLDDVYVDNAAGGADLTLAVETARVGDRLRVRGATAGTSVTLTDARTGYLDVAGPATVSLDGSRAERDVRLDGTARFRAIGGSSIGRDVRYTCRGQLAPLGALDWTSTVGLDASSVGRNVRMQTAGACTLDMANGALVAGGVCVRGAGQSAYTLADSTIHRPVTIRGGNAADVVELSHMVIGGGLNIRTAGGDDEVHVEDTRVAGRIAADLGAGNDEIRFGPDDPDLGQSTCIVCGVRVKAGAGDDTLYVGQFASQGGGVDLNGHILLDGGLGQDRLSILPGASPVLRSIEQQIVA